MSSYFCAALYSKSLLYSILSIKTTIKVKYSGLPALFTRNYFRAGSPQYKKVPGAGSPKYKKVNEGWQPLVQKNN